LGVVGDSADGFPGIPGWGAKSASAVLAQYKKLESIPKDPAKWKVPSITPGRAASLAESLSAHWEDAQLFRKIATVRTDVPLNENLNDLKWRGARADLEEFCVSLGDSKISTRVKKWQ
jgi:5'-3' exonuclease